MGIPRRLGRLARGIVSNLQDDERVRERLRAGRERGETLRGAFEAALRGAAEEWRRAEERRAAEEQTAGESAGEGSAAGGGWRPSATTFTPGRYPPNVLAAYRRLNLSPGAPIQSVDRRRRELVKRHHPDRFADPGERARAERTTAEINAAHDAIERHLLRR